MSMLENEKAMKTGRILPWSLFFLVALALSISRDFFPESSPWDETSHLSYVQAMMQFHVPAYGEIIGSWTKDVFSCFPGTMTLVPCGEYGAAINYPQFGLNSSQGWPPLGFAVIAFFGAPFVWLGIEPLFAIRIGTSIVWSLGVAFLGLISLRKSSSLMSAFIVVFLLTALPIFGYFTSAVSPHALNPLLTALALYLSFRWIEAYRSDAGIRSTWRWPLFMLGASVVGAFTIPHSLTIFLTAIVFVTLYLTFAKQSVTQRLRVGALGSLTAILSALIYGGTLLLWGWIQTLRTLPTPAEASGVPGWSGGSEVTYSNGIDLILKRWASFWPNGIQTGWTGDDALTHGIENVWMVLLLLLTIAGFLIFKAPHWVKFLIGAVLITAPITSIAYDWYFPEAVPARYGMGIVLVGIFAVANIKMPRVATSIVLALAVATYALGFMVDPMYPLGRACKPEPDGRVVCKVYQDQKIFRW
jgi:hypothetical protein